VDEFIAYAQTQGQFALDSSQEEALLFTAAERHYLAGRFAEAITALERYLTQYPNGGEQIKANYYLAESYAAQNETAKARDLFAKIAGQKGNPFAEDAAAKAAEVYFAEHNYSEAKRYYEILKARAQSKAVAQQADLGIVRCEARMLNNEQVVLTAAELQKQDIADADMLRELRYYQAKSLLTLGRGKEAEPFLQELIKEPRTAEGSEAYYLLADYRFSEEKNAAKAEQLINEFIAKSSPHQYWTAQCFILLADLSIAAGDDFQAKQYLLSLQSNYKGEEPDIKEEIGVRLEEIEERE
jgi:TolA-binding protein